MKVSCFGCVFFSITHDPQNPYACLAYGFRSRRIPSIEVLATSGLECQRRKCNTNVAPKGRPR